MGNQGFTEQQVEAINAAQRQQLEERARDNYLRQLKSDRELFASDVLLQDEVQSALHAYWMRPGSPNANAQLYLAVDVAVDNATKQYVANNWEPRNARGDYVVGRCAPVQP